MPTYSLDEIKFKASGRWPEIINRIAGIPDDYLTVKHGPCPKCGGNDRWRTFNDFKETGGCVCSTCGVKLADGFEVIQWFCGVDFSEALKRVANHLGVSVAKTPRNGLKPNGRCPSLAPRRANKNDEAKAKEQLNQLEPLPWNEMLVAIWCTKKKPLTPAAVKQAGGIVARYKGQLTVVAIPVSCDGDRINWIIYNITGGLLPAGKKEEREWIKVKNLTKYPGLAGIKNNQESNPHDKHSRN